MVLEKLVCDKIYDFVPESSISVFQFGVCSTLKATTPLQRLPPLSLWWTLTPGLYLHLDICKAFESVSHNKLLPKLWDAGINGSGRNLSSHTLYLSNCRQCVVFDEKSSGWLPVTPGEPQGSILGTLPFVLYINDNSAFLPFCHPNLYDDDTKCGKRVLSLFDFFLLQTDLNYLTDWTSQTTFLSMPQGVVSYA